MDTPTYPNYADAAGRPRGLFSGLGTWGGQHLGILLEDKGIIPSPGAEVGVPLQGEVNVALSFYRKSFGA